MGKVRVVSWIGLVAFACVSGVAHAWNDTGHFVIALAAWDSLDPHQRAQVSELMSAHPRFEEDFLARLPRGSVRTDDEAQRRWLFAMASAWPDYARSFHEVRESAERERLVEQNHRSRWHFVNIPTLLVEDRDWEKRLAPVLAPPTRAQWNDPSLNIVQALTASVERLSSPTSRGPDRAIALCWVLHLGADLHQPLHATALFAQGALELGDRGGNELLLERSSNLHALWDGALGVTRDRRKLDAMVRALRAHETPAGVRTGEFADWARESQRIASRDAYTPAIRQAVRQHGGRSGRVVVPIDSDYRRQMGASASHQAAIAALRLASILGAALESP